MPLFKQHNSNTFIEDFVRTQRNKTITWLHNTFQISTDDCEDIFQEAFIVLYNNIKDGKLDKMTSSVSTYFRAICKNKTMELFRTSGRYTQLNLDVSDDTHISFADNKIENILSLDDDDSVAIEEKEGLVRTIVRNLPSPCNELLWGYYRDGLSMKALAQEYGYNSENSVKVTKHRCCEKFREKFKMLLKNLH